MGLITSLAVGFFVFLLVQYIAPSMSIWVAVFVAGFAAGLFAEGILKGLFVGLVICVLGIFIVSYFYGGIPGLDSGNLIDSLTGMVGIGLTVLASIAGIAGSKLRTFKFRK